MILNWLTQAMILSKTSRSTTTLPRYCTFHCFWMQSFLFFSASSRTAASTSSLLSLMLARLARRSGDSLSEATRQRSMATDSRLGATLGSWSAQNTESTSKKRDGLFFILFYFHVSCKRSHSCCLEQPAQSIARPFRLGMGVQSYKAVIQAAEG